jgi:hypothetical protein
MHRLRLSPIACAIAMAFLGMVVLAAQAPAPAQPTAEQVAIQKAMLAKDAYIGELLRNYSQCEGDKLDLGKLKALVTQLEALEKKPEVKKDLKPAEPVKP